MIRLICEKHPRYNGRKPPMASCNACKFLEELVIHIDMGLRPVLGGETVEKEDWQRTLKIK